MTPQAIIALKKSIAHWTKLASGDLHEHVGRDYCDLCTEFHSFEHECAGCPIREAVGKPFCQGTPYSPNISDEDDVTPDDLDDVDRDSEEFRVRSREELEFLKSLLPEDEQ